MCGFRQSTLVTVPLSVICSLPYSAAVEWCAKAMAVKQSPIKTNCKVRSIWIPPERRRDTGLESFCRLKGEDPIRRAPLFRRSAILSLIRGVADFPGFFFPVVFPSLGNTIWRPGLPVGLLHFCG